MHVKPWDQLSLPVRSPSSLSWRCGVRSSFPRGGHWAEGRQDALSRTVSPSLLLWASGSSRLRGEGANGGPSPTLHVCVCMYLCMCMCMYVCVHECVCILPITSQLQKSLRHTAFKPPRIGRQRKKEEQSKKCIRFEVEATVLQIFQFRNR